MQPRIRVRPIVLDAILVITGSLVMVAGDFMAEPFHRFRGSERKIIEMAVNELRNQVHALVSA